MPTDTFHFLNVKDGDCSIIEHGSGHVSVIDVCNAETVTTQMSASEFAYLEARAKVSGNFQQKTSPVNPVEYLNKFKVDSVFRFVLTHPDMDHMDGIKDFFECFSPPNFYDIANKKEMEFPEGSPYNEEDWEFYKKLRDMKPQNDPKRLELYSGDDGVFTEPKIGTAILPVTHCTFWLQRLS